MSDVTAKLKDNNSGNNTNTITLLNFYCTLTLCLKKLINTHISLGTQQVIKLISYLINDSKLFKEAYDLIIIKSYIDFITY